MPSRGERRRVESRARRSAGRDERAPRPDAARASARGFFLPESPPQDGPALRAWHVGAVVLLALLAPLQMWPWLSSDVLPAGDALGYATAIEHVRRHLAGDAGLASWCTKWFGGTTHFTSNLKEIALVPLEAALGPIAGIKVMLLVARVVAGLAMYALVFRLFAAPAAALVASYAYVWGTAANIQVGLGGHLDVVLCYALFPMLVRAAIGVADGSLAAAIATGALLAAIFCLHYAQGVVSWVVVGLLLVLRPWRAEVVPDRRQLAIVLATFAVLAAAPLVTSVVDQPITR